MVIKAHTHPFGKPEQAIQIQGLFPPRLEFTRAIMKCARFQNCITWNGKDKATFEGGWLMLMELERLVAVGQSLTTNPSHDLPTLAGDTLREDPSRLKKWSFRGPQPEIHVSHILFLRERKGRIC